MWRTLTKGSLWLWLGESGSRITREGNGPAMCEPVCSGVMVGGSCLPDGNCPITDHLPLHRSVPHWIRFLASSSFQMCCINAKPTICLNSSCRLVRSPPSSQAAPRATTRLNSLHASGPMPPHVPNAIGKKAQPALRQALTYLSFFARSLRLRKTRHLSLVCAVAITDCSDTCQPWHTVRSTATSVLASQQRNNRSAGLSWPSGQSGITTSLANGCPASVS